jgi:hypothetical protein
MNEDDEIKGVTALLHLNKLYPKKTEYVKKWSWGRVNFTYEHRSKDNLWGRFGGGWQWELGFQASSSTIIFNLLVSSLRVSWYHPK